MTEGKRRAIIMRYLFPLLAIVLAVGFSVSSVSAAPLKAKEGAAETGSAKTSAKLYAPNRAGSSPMVQYLCVDDNPAPQPTGAPCTNTMTYTTIADALAVAQPGDEIRLAGGTYYGTGNSVATVSVNNLFFLGGFSGGTCGNCWTQMGQPTASSVDGQGLRKGFEVQGTNTVTIHNLTISNGGILNNSGTVRVTMSPVPPSTCTTNIEDGGTTNGAFVVETGAAICFPSGGQTLGNGTAVTGNGVLRVNGGIVTVGTSNTHSVTVQNFELSGTNISTLTGVGVFTVSNTFTWLGGTMDGPFVNDPGTTIIPVGAVMNLAGVSTNKYLLQRHLENYGTINMNGTGTGALRMGNQAVLNNHVGATFNIYNNDSVLYETGEYPTFNNYGTVTKHAGTGTSTFGSSFSYLVSSGAINVNAGTLSLDGGASPGTPDIITGTVSVAPLATVRFGGVVASRHTFAPQSSITGAGNTNFNQGTTDIAGTYNMSGVTYVSGGTGNFIQGITATTEAVNHSSGTIGGNGTLNVLSAYLWTGGTQRGDVTGGVTNISATSVFTIAGVNASKYLLQRTLNNNGTAVVNGTGTGTVFLGDGAIFNNNSGAMFEIRNDDSVKYQPNTTASVFVNGGTIRKTGGAGISVMGSGSASFDNVGVVDVLTGTFSLEGGGTDSGQFNLSERTTLRFNGGTHLLQSAATIGGAGSVQVNAGSAHFAGTYSITGSTKVTGGTARFDSNIVTSDALLSSGTLTGTGTIDASLFNWTGGTMAGPGITNISSTGVMTIGGVSSTKYLLQQRTLNNNGQTVVNTTGTGTMYIGDGAVFNNNPGAVFDIRNNDSFLHSPNTTNAQFNNSGTVRKSMGLGAGISTMGSGNLAFNNSSLVEVLTGTLSLDGGGTHSGSFDMESVANLRFNGGTHQLQSASSINGEGNVTISGGTTNVASENYNITGNTLISGGTVNFEAQTTTAMATMSGGTLAGTGVFNVGNTFNWTGGTMAGPGTTNVASGATLNLGGVASTKILSQRTFNNRGTVNMNGTGNGTFQLKDGATFNNEAGATYNIQNNDTINSGGGTAPRFNNAGMFRKSAGLGISNVGSGSFIFNNTGTVEMLSGVINWGASYVQTDGTTRLNGGHMSTVGAVSLTLDGGTLTGNGIITGTVANNAGQVSPGLPAGTLTVTTYRQGANGSLKIELGGLNAGSEFDTLRVTGAATLAGALNLSLINGFVPAFNNTFEIMIHGSRTGTFSTVTGTQLPNGLYIGPLYNSGNITLHTTGQPIPSPTAGTPTATPVVTVTPPPGGCTINFSDVLPTDFFYEPVRYLFCGGIIGGYADGTFRPYANTTRGQLTKIVVLAEGWSLMSPPSPTFTDVPTNHTFYQYIETAFAHGVIGGYTDGTFRPGNDVTRGQLAKIVVLAEGWTQVCPGVGTFSDVPRENPFYCYIETAVDYAIIGGYLDGTFRPGNSATRGQISKIVYNAITQR